MASQNQEMSFTDLLNQDDSLMNLSDSVVNLDDSSSLPPNNATIVNKCTRARGANFSIAEDKLLVASWLNCSIDGIQGTDQKYTQLWGKISDHFHQYNETTTKRTTKSLIHRWSCIQKATNKFCAKVAQVEGLNPSGTNEQDKLEKAKIMYEKLEKSVFQFEHCWNLLKNQAKWISHSTKDVQKKKKIVSFLTPTPGTTSPPTQNVAGNEIVEIERPMGRKAEKAKRKAQGRLSEESIEHRKMKYTLLEESRAQEKEFYRLQAEKMEHDKVMEDKRLHLEEERLRLDAERLKNEAQRLKNEAQKLSNEAENLRIESEKSDRARRESDERIMMMDVTFMPESQRLYFEKLQMQIMLTGTHA